MKTKLLLLFFIVSAIVFVDSFRANAQQPGDNDPTFNPTDHGFSGGKGANNRVFTTAMQNDGKIIIGGDFTSYNGTAINRIARLNSDGTLDGTFNVGTGANFFVYTTVIQSDGKIIIGGDFTSYSGTGRTRIMRVRGEVCVSPSVVAIAAATTVCAGTMITLTGAGASSYAWSGGVTDGVGFIPASSSTYTVIGTDLNGCADTAFITVTVDIVSAGLTMVKDTANALLWYVYPAITGTAPFTYLWDFGDGSTSTLQYPTHTYSVAAHYAICLTVTDAKGCISTACDSTYRLMTTDSIKFLVVADPLTAGIKNLVNENDISVYPNPTTGVFALQLAVYELQNDNISIYNMFGEKVYSSIRQLNNSTIDISSHPSGVYFLQIKTEEGTSVKKIIVQK